MIRKILVTLLLSMTLYGPVAAQSRSSQLPRLGMIKDYPATGMMVGCGNLYSELEGTTNNSGDKYVFLARGDGSDGWMNLNGRDTHLRLLKTETQFSNDRATVVRHVYPFLRTQIIVTTRLDGEPDSDGAHSMSIALIRGKAKRIFRAKVTSDC